MWRVHVDSLKLPSMIITNNDNCLPFQFPWKPFLHAYMGVPFQNVLARNSGLVKLETRTTTSPYWPKKVQAESSHMYFCDYLATLGQMYTTGVTSGLAVNRVNQPLPFVFSHTFSNDENVAALRKCFKDSALHPVFQQPVLKEFLKQMCSVVGIGLWSYP